MRTISIILKLRYALLSAGRPNLGPEGSLERAPTAQVDSRGSRYRLKQKRRTAIRTLPILFIQNISRRDTFLIFLLGIFRYYRLNCHQNSAKTYRKISSIARCKFWHHDVCLLIKISRKMRLSQRKSSKAPPNKNISVFLCINIKVSLIRSPNQ